MKYFSFAPVELEVEVVRTVQHFVEDWVEESNKVEGKNKVAIRLNLTCNIITCQKEYYITWLEA